MLDDFLVFNLFFWLEDFWFLFDDFFIFFDFYYLEIGLVKIFLKFIDNNNIDIFFGGFFFGFNWEYIKLFLKFGWFKNRWLVWLFLSWIFIVIFGFFKLYFDNWEIEVVMERLFFKFFSLFNKNLIVGKLVFFFIGVIIF